MKKQIISKIVTPRLVLRPIIMDDADAYFEAEIASTSELLPHWSWAKTDKSVDDVKKFISTALACHSKECPEEMNFSILSKEDNRFLGMLWFFEINWFVPTFEMLYWLDTRETGKGYMTEAINALARASFQVYAAKRIQIKVSVSNSKSIAIPQKLGFKLEAEMENYFFNFVTENVTNGLLFSCCDIKNLPPLNISL